jgi:molecular chaperone HscB
VFGLVPTWSVDREALRVQLLALTRRVHPDYFVSDDEQRALAERNTAELNAAYDVLDDDFRRADWLVRAQGGPDEKAERQMPQAFLMEVLEWNEALDEAKSAAPGSPARDLSALESTLRQQRDETFTSLAQLFDLLPGSGSPALTDARRLLNAARYLDRTLAEIASLRLEQASSR